MKPPVHLARLGWRLLPLHDVTSGACSCQRDPCPNPGKHPRLKAWAESASNDPTVLDAWAEKFPGANWGAATGAESGFIVLDVDGPAGLASLDEHGPRPRTATQETGRGGLHLLFQHPGFPVSNSAGKLGEGLDIRGDGGQIVIAPSRTTGAYRWLVPPWELAPQPMPAWVLEWLRQRKPKTEPAPAVNAIWPPASPEVLEAAWTALVRRGNIPAGQGGGGHLVMLAAVLTHDYALSDEEAIPLMRRWCDQHSPRTEDEIRDRVRKGRAYGNRPFGCERPEDALEVARQLITTWRGHELGLVAAVRPFLSAIEDPSAWEILAKQLSAAAGVRDLGVKKPKAKARPLEQGEIQLGVDLHRVADEASAAIAPRLYQRGGRFVEVVTLGTPTIRELGAPGIIDYMSLSSRYVRHDEKLGIVPAAPPPLVAAMVLERPRPGVRQLDAVVSSPVLLPDGSVLQEQGYSEEARVWLEPRVQVAVPSWPTRDDAREAIGVLWDVFREFRFATDADWSACLAGICSPLVKPAIHNEATPLLVVSAAKAGAGKSLLAWLVSQVATGQPPAIRPYAPRAAEEWGKKLTSFVKEGAVVNVFDDAAGPIGDESLNRLLTASGWADRAMGTHEAPLLPVVGTWVATGNNLEVVGDCVRRCLVVKLLVLEDQPQERETDRSEEKLREEVLNRRGELLGAALTILRAYCAADRPDVGLAPWGSFAPWSALVRGALVWAGCEDPYLTQKRAQVELTSEDFEAHDFWLEVVSSSDGTLKGIADVAYQRKAQEVLGMRRDPTPHLVRKWIRPYLDRPRLGRRIVQRETVLAVEKVPS